MADQPPKLLDTSKLKLLVADRVAPFFERILAERKDLVVALHVIGSAVTDDFDQDRSDINTLIVVREMDLGFLDLLQPLCREHADARIVPPLLITPPCIEQWRADSPVELLDFKLINALVYGTDLLSGVDIEPSLLRLQCRRELRGRLVTLSWGYVRAAGNKRTLTQLLADSVSGLAPLIRGILHARGETPPLTVGPLFDALSRLIGPSALSFKEVYWMKLRKTKMPVSRVRETLKDYYRATELLIDVIDQAEPPNA